MLHTPCNVLLIIFKGYIHVCMSLENIICEVDMLISYQPTSIEIYIILVKLDVCMHFYVLSQCVKSSGWIALSG